MLKKLLRIPLEEATFARRQFRGTRSSTRERLEHIGETFLYGYHAALNSKEIEPLSARLSEIEPQYCGFAFEGAAMAFDLLDQLNQFAPWKTPRLSKFMEELGSPHIYMLHVGAGWSLARMPLRLERRLARFDPVLRWLVLDGYGFHEGYFHWSRYQDGVFRPKRLDFYGQRVFDQGLGRSLWFVGGADVEWIADAIATFPDSRQSDLWSGVGLACAYAGGVHAPEIEFLRFAAKTHYPHLAQGVIFAAGARSRAGNPAEHTELACQLLCGLPAQKAAVISDETRNSAKADSEPAYEVWRRLIRAHFSEPYLSKPKLA